MSAVAEQAVIAALLWDPAVAPEVALTVEDFADQGTRLAFAAIQRLRESGATPDLVSVAQELEARGELDYVGGWAALMDWAALPGTAASAAHYAELVRTAALRRRAVDEAQRLLAALQDAGRDPGDTAAAAAARFADLAAGDAERHHPAVISAARAVLDALDYLTTRWSDGGRPLATPWPSLDAFAGGLGAGELVVLAARPGVGKTTAALQMAAHTAAAGRRVLYVSYEMAPSRLAVQLAAQRYGLDRYAALQGWDPRLTERIQRELPTWPLDWWRAGDRPTWDAVRREIPRLQRQTPALALVVVDHLELVPVPGHRAWPEELASLCADLKATAERYGLAVLVCQQLSRRADDSREPQLGDLGWSSGIEKAADKVWILDRVDRQDPASDRVLYVRKHRDGPTGHVTLRWDARPTRLVDPVEGSA